MLKKLIQISHIQLLGLFLLHFCLGCLLAMQTGGVVGNGFFLDPIGMDGSFLFGVSLHK